MEVPGIRRVRSRTFRGATEISAQFDPNTDMAAALQLLQSRVEEARSGMPANVELTTERLTASTFPILSVNLTGKLAIAELRDHAFYVVRPAVSRVPGVGRVEPHEWIIGPHLRTVAEHGFDLTRHPVADVNHQRRWLCVEPEGIRDYGPWTRSGLGPAPLDGGVEHLSYDALRHRHANQSEKT